VHIGKKTVVVSKNNQLKIVHPVRMSQSSAQKISQILPEGIRRELEQMEQIGEAAVKEQQK